MKEPLKSRVRLSNGSVVTIEETREEIVVRISWPRVARLREKDVPRTMGGRIRAEARGPAGRIRNLKDAGFFRTKRAIGDIKDKLEEGGHLYELSAISPALIRMVRNHELRRIKDGGLWKYVNP